MELFLVNGFITVRRYMVEGESNYENIRLVRAENSQAAGEKYQKYWEEKSEPYYKTYYCQIVDISGVLE